MLQMYCEQIYDMHMLRLIHVFIHSQTFGIIHNFFCKQADSLKFSPTIASSRSLYMYC